MHMRRQNRRLFTFGVLVLLAIGLLTLGSRSGVLRPLVSAVTIPLAPIARLFNDGTDSALGLTETAEDYETLQRQNAEDHRARARGPQGQVGPHKQEDAAEPDE